MYHLDQDLQSTHTWFLLYCKSDLFTVIPVVLAHRHAVGCICATVASEFGGVAAPSAQSFGKRPEVLTCRWFDNTLFTTFRGKLCYDGGLTNFIPLPPTQHGVRVCCFPSKQITTIYDIGISPDNYEDWPHTLQEMLSWAFEPAEDKLLLEFIGELPNCATESTLFCSDGSI